jgi:TRAP-type transport system periplasmic protein
MLRGHIRELKMRFSKSRVRKSVALSIGASVLALGVAGAPARADDKAIVMKISMPTLNDALNEYGKMFAAAVEKDSGGRIKGEVYPASQLGSIPRQIEGVQFGAIQVEVCPPEFFVGIDERFQVLTAPGLVTGMDNGVRLSEDAAALKLMLGLGANKGLHGLGLIAASPSSVSAKAAIRHLDDFKGKKIRIFASDFQSVALSRLGATPVAMSLGDVLPALQQGAIDGAIGGMAVWSPMHYQEAAKFVTETGQPFIFGIVEVSKKWYDGLPKDLQAIIDRDGAAVAVADNPVSVKMYAAQRKDWVANGGELISLPPDEQASMMETLGSVAEDVSKTKPAVHEAYETVLAEAKKTR